MLIEFNYLAHKYNFRPKGVLHIGANRGEEANAYHNLKAEKVYWIEALPAMFLKLKGNVSKYPNQYAFNFCVGDEHDKEVVFHVANNDSQSSSLLELGTHKEAHPEVKYSYDVKLKMVRIDKIGLNLEGFDFLNIDLQGAELMALNGMGTELERFKYPICLGLIPCCMN